MPYERSDWTRGEARGYLVVKDEKIKDWKRLCSSVRVTACMKKAHAFIGYALFVFADFEACASVLTSLMNIYKNTFVFLKIPLVFSCFLTFQ